MLTGFTGSPAVSITRRRCYIINLSTVAPPFGPLLQNDFKEIENMTRILQNGTTPFASAIKLSMKRMCILPMTSSLIFSRSMLQKVILKKH